MTVQSRTTLKSYFITGASPSESDFADLIDSTLLVGDLVDSLTSTSTVKPLTAASGKVLNDSITSLTTRVVTLESQETDFANNYYTKTEVDAKLNAIDASIDPLILANFQGQIDDLQAQIDNIEVGGSPSASISISSVTGLQSALDAKASIVQLNDVRDSLIASINAIDTSGGTVDLSGINASIDTLNDEIDALEAQLATKADATHTHGNIYTKTEVDTLLDNLDLLDHTHVAADITDLGQEIQTKTNLLVDDHANLRNNPHAVTKAQIGLERVENLTPAEMVSAAGIVTQTDIDTVQNDLATHKQAINPHGVTKSDIGLSNVSNVNAQQLLDEHIASDNPHNIDLSYFDVYATAEADARTVFHINSVRYAFTPLSNNDSAGAIGDFAYDQNNLYFKTGSTQWMKLPFSPVYIQREATQEDVDAGLALTVGEIITVNEVALPEITQINVTENFNITNNEGDQVFNITEEGDIYLTDTTIENITIQGDTIVNETISSTTNEITIEGNQTTIEGNTIIEGDQTTINNDLTVSGDTTLNNINVTTEQGDSILNINEDGDIEIQSIQINNGDANLDTASVEYISAKEVHLFQPNANWPPITEPYGILQYDHASERLLVDTDSSVAYLSDFTGYVTETALQSALENINLSGGSTDDDGNSTDGSTETDIVLPGTTGGINSGYAVGSSGQFYAIDYGPDGTYDTADDVEEEYWALDTSAPSSTGLVIDLGDGDYNPYLRYDVTLNNWQIFNGGSSNQPYDIADSYSKTESDARYDNRYALQTRVAMTDGAGGTNIILQGLSSGTPVDTGIEVDFGTGSNPYIHFDVAEGKWFAFDGTTEIEIGAVINNTTINEGDNVTNTTILNQTIVQESLTIDGTSGGTADSYATTEYDDGTGTLVAEKYSIDYGADGVYGTADDDDSEDYWEDTPSTYTNAGLTVNAGLDPNPSIVYDGTANRWLVDDGGSYGTFYLGEAEGYVAYDQAQTLTSAEQTQARSNIGAQAAGNYLTSVPSEYLTETEGDNRYLQSVPSEYLTQTEGDARYYTQEQVDQIVGQFPTRQQVLEWIVASSNGTLSVAEYSVGSGGNYSIDYGADGVYGTADDGNNSPDEDYSYESSLAA